MKRPKKRPPLRGEVSVPGDKSISHRALIAGALANGSSTIQGLSVAGDVVSTVRCLRALGARIEVDEEGRSASVAGGRSLLAEPAEILDAGNSGTTLRLLAGVCSSVQGQSVLTGDETLRRRPMLRVVLPLRQMGASIEGRRNGELAPLVVRGGRLRGLEFDLKVASAQVKSALLLAGLAAEGVTAVTEPAPSRDHTERMLEHAGVKLTREGATVSLEGPQEVEPRSWTVPGDISSALYLIVSALLVPGSELTVTGVGLNPTRTAALDVLMRMGADLDIEVENESQAGEPTGRVRARSSELRGTKVAGDEVPRLIDEIPVLAIAATQAEGETTFSDAEELRHKESDRIDSMVAGLRALGAEAEATPDGFVVRGPGPLSGATVESRGDHRVALSFAVAGLVSVDTVTVNGWGATKTSFPEFLDLVRKTTGTR